MAGSEGGLLGPRAREPPTYSARRKGQISLGAYLDTASTPVDPLRRGCHMPAVGPGLRRLMSSIVTSVFLEICTTHLGNILRAEQVGACGLEGVGTPK